MDPKIEINKTNRLCYSREFLLKYEAKNVISFPESPTMDLKSPIYFHSKKKVNQNGKIEKPDTRSPEKSYHGNSTVAPPGIITTDPLENDFFQFKANSFSSAEVNYHQPELLISGDQETPKIITSSPDLSPYTKFFSPNVYPDLECYGESKFMSLFSQPANISGEINLKPYLSFDFLEDTPQPCLPKTPQPKALLHSHKSPSNRYAKTSPRSRPVSTLGQQRIIQRQRQIDYGHRTVGYMRYILEVPKESRKPDHPRTPKKSQRCSKRSWDGQLKKWRRDLHLWDPDNLEAFRVFLHSEVVEMTMVFTRPELKDLVLSVREKLNNPNIYNLNTEEDDYYIDDEDDKDDEVESLGGGGGSYSSSHSYLRPPHHSPSPLKTVAGCEDDHHLPFLSNAKLSEVARTLIF